MRHIFFLAITLLNFSLNSQPKQQSVTEKFNIITTSNSSNLQKIIDLKNLRSNYSAELKKQSLLKTEILRFESHAYKSLYNYEKAKKQLIKALAILTKMISFKDIILQKALLSDELAQLYLDENSYTIALNLLMQEQYFFKMLNVSNPVLTKKIKKISQQTNDHTSCFSWLTKHI